MRNLTSPAWIVTKGILFLILALLAALMLLARNWDLRTALLFAIAVWAFCRFYYFVFYVIEHYVDPTYRFNGLLSLVQHFARTKRRKP
jgi:hypothetical protein